MVLHLHILPAFYLLNNLGRSVANNTLASPEIKSAKTTGDRAFAVAAPVLWNALPPSVRAILITLLHSRNNNY